MRGTRRLGASSSNLLAREVTLGGRVAFVLLAAAFGLFLLAAHIYYTHTGGEPAGGPIGTILPWLFADAPRLTLWEV